MCVPLLVKRGCGVFSKATTAAELDKINLQLDWKDEKDETPVPEKMGEKAGASCA